MPSVKAVRGETQEERHWKQLQAYRQQQAQQQQLALQEQRLQGDPKDHHNSGKHPYSQPGKSFCFSSCFCLSLSLFQLFPWCIGK